MHKLTREQYWGNLSQFNRKERSQEQQIGLFTFYKQQQDQQSFFQPQPANKRTQNTRKHKGTSKFKFQIVDKSPKVRQVSSGEKQQSSKAENCEQFLKNIGIKTFKPNYSSIKDPFAKKWAEDTKTKSFDMTQKQNPNNLQINKLKQSAELKQFNFAINPQQGFISRPLKKMENPMQICSDKVALDKDRSQEKNQKTNERPKKIKSIIVQQQTIKLGDSIQERSHSRKICKILLKKEAQQKQMSTTLQRLFLKKVRETQSQELKAMNLQQQTKQQTGSYKKLKDVHNQNKKYFGKLINSFYLNLNHNQTNQTAKILRNTLKFPNFIKKCHLKTDISLSPDQIKKIAIQQRATSCKKEFLNTPKRKPKESNPERLQLKPSLNQRFKFLLKNQKPMNKHFDSQKLRDRDIFIKSQTKK